MIPFIKLNILFAFAFLLVNSKETDPLYVLTYFPFRGRAEFIRLILEYKKIPYKMEIIQFKDWPTVKKDIAPSGTLPYITFNNKRFGQSHAIARFLGSRHGLKAKNSIQRLHLDHIVGIYDDVFMKVVNILKSATKDPESAVDSLTEFNSQWCDYYLPLFEQLFSKYTKSGNYILGNTLTWADFWMYEAFDVHNNLSPDCMANFPRITAFYKAMDSLPELENAKSTRLDPHPFLKAVIDKLH